MRLGERANTLRFNALATLALALALVPALLAAGPFALIAALLLTAPPRAAVGTIAYSLAAAREQSGRSGDGFVFGTLNGCWAGATVLAPLLAGALDQRAGVDCALLVVVIPGLAIAAWLVARSGVRRTIARDARNGRVVAVTARSVASVRRSTPAAHARPAWFR